MKKKLKIAIIAILLLTVLLVSGVLIWYNNAISGNKENTNQIIIEIETGSTMNSVGIILEEKEVISSAVAFKLYSKLNDKNAVIAGKYCFTPSMSFEEIIKILEEGQVYTGDEIKLTYIEGKNVRWLAKKIDELTNNTEQDVYDLLKDEEYIDKLINKYWFITEEIKDEDIYYALEGYLFPDTYAIENKDTTVEEIFEKMLDKMESVLNEYKNEIENSKYSIHELLTIASIVEMEAMNEVDRAGVASVIYNRLSSNMAIQSDVTTYYAFKIDMGERDLYQTEIDTYNGYNTRGPNMAGKLPVGPISSISASSIRATIQPESTDYLFFVADKNGKVYFSRNNSEHDQTIRDLKTQGLWYIYE